MGDVIPITSGALEFVRPPDLPFTCSDDDLLQAVQMWLLGYPASDVAKLVQVPAGVLKHWVKSHGWKHLEEFFREEIRKVSHSQITRLAHKSLDKLEERIENGDPVFDMEGTQIGTRPVRAKDLAQIHASLVDRQLEIEKRMGGKQEDELISLRELAEGLRRYGKAKEIPA